MNPYNIYEQLPASVWFLTAVFLIICVYLLERVRVKQKIKEDNVESEQQISNDRGIRLIECNMPNCIRCTKNVHILELAKHRLTAFSIPTSVPEKIYAELKNCVSNIMEDLQEALNDKVRSGDAANSNKLSDDTAVALTVSTPTVVFLRGLAEKAFFSETEFLGVDKLVDGFEKIYLEFLHLYQSPLPETKPLWIRNNTDSGSWEISHLVNQGRITKAGELCPLTMQILNQMSSFMNNNLFGNAAFSVVHPQTEIATHCGSTNFRIRSHLGLQIPSSNCKLQVNDVKVEWERGEILCFNDAFPHSVWHNGSQTSGFRAILLVDLWHPDISKSQKEILNHIFCPTTTNS